MMTKKPSLSITVRDARILLRCHAGCRAEAIVSAMGLKTADLFLSGEPPGRLVATYDYCDEGGTVLFQKLRYVPKTFRQRRPDGNGGWTWNMNGVRTVLYNLPEVLEAKRALVLEGEKDADTARSLGYTGTCNPEGANSWKDEYSESLRGKNVVVVGDADPPGLAHTHDVAKALLGVAASVRLIEAMPAAKDLSEFAEKVNDPAECKRLVEALIADTAPLTPADVAKWRPAKAETGFALAELGELMSLPEEPIDWVVEARYAEGTFNIVVAKPKVGKSTYGRNVTFAVSRGEPFLGLRTKQGLCVYLGLEERAADLVRDFRAMGARGDEEILIHSTAPPAHAVEEAIDLLQERRPRLLVIDPLFRLIKVDERAYGEMYQALGPLIDVARSTGTVILALHHSPKVPRLEAVDSPLGTTALAGAVASVTTLKRTQNYRTVESVQRLGLDLPETVLAYDPETRKLSLAGTRAEAERLECEKAIVRFLRTTGEPLTQKEIRQGVEGTTAIIRAALTSLVAAGRLARTGDGMKGKPFKYQNSEGAGSMLVRDEPNSILEFKEPL